MSFPETKTSAVGPDIYALDAAQETLWHSTPRQGGFGLYNPEHLAPVFLLKALARARMQGGVAVWMGRQTIRGVVCHVVDYSTEQLRLRLWIGAADDLPRRIEAQSEGLFDHDALVISVGDWELGGTAREGDFELALPAGYKRAEYRSAEGRRWD